MAGTTSKSKIDTRPGTISYEVVKQYNALVADLNTRGLSAPNPVIKTGGSPLAKTGAAPTVALVGGVAVHIAASTDLAALTGINISAGAYNVVIWCTDAAGTTTAHAGTEGASLAAVVWPTIGSGKAPVGGAYITYASAFTGGTTPLDTATTVYFSTNGLMYQAMQAAKVGNPAGTAIS